MSDSISNDISDPVLKSIINYKDDSVIKANKKVSKLNSLFHFYTVGKREILNEIVNLNAWKSRQDTDVLTKNVKKNADNLTDFIYPIINASVKKNEFQPFSKLADMMSVFKKDSKNSTQLRTSMLKNISKVYERFTFKEIADFMENFLSTFKFGFRKENSTNLPLIRENPLQPH